MKQTIFTLFLFSILLFGCAKNEKKTLPPQFQLLRKAETGLDFENVLKPSSEFNVFNYMYFFNGGGVAAEDFNQDGWTDLFFTSNMGPNKLFLNEAVGSLKFRDVTETAGVAGTDGWSTGVTVVDINQDGLPDLYVGQLGEYLEIEGRNQLLVCQGVENGVPTYVDMAAEYGLDLKGFSTQAVFFDYDLDGDLDLFQLNHSVHENGTFGEKENFIGTQHPTSGDRLFRNDGGKKLTEVTLESGINSTVVGYGLGVVAGDVNNDGWPDLYIGNDFHENDYLYLNQKDGTFREVLTENIMHTSRFSMGVEMGDLNNDGWSEIISLDMLPADPFILKSSLGEDDFDVFQFKLTFGFNHQFARNNLQLNHGFAEGKNQPNFSEVAMFSGVHATDWSWAPLFLDFDNDGRRDLFISNGINRRMNDIDYVNFMADNELRWKRNGNVLDEEDLLVVEKMPQIKLPNAFFKNTTADLGEARPIRFDDIVAGVSGAAESYSNGAIYADFDQDGDLDLVTNNIGDEPFLYQNLNVENASNGDWFALELKGAEGNLRAIGARAVVYKKGQKMIFENFPVRGYQSANPAGLHIGVGLASEVDSVLLIWPNGRYERLADLRFNEKNKVEYRADLPRFDFSFLQKKEAPKTAWKDITEEADLNFEHEETVFIEFNRERLIPMMTSTQGPALAVGDVNGDGREDVFFGSSKWERNRLYLQTETGIFSEKTIDAFRQDSVYEDVQATFADLDNDGDLDLAVAAGGNEFWGEQKPRRQRAYLNDGAGNFTRHELPEIYLTAACVVPFDYNGDGLTDLFFGGRTVPWKYGIVPPSFLLKNKGNGQFENVSGKMGVGEIGMVRSGHAHDMDADGDLDLLLALEWDAIQVLENKNGRFKARPLSEHQGWWNFALPHDFDGDGDVDILAGNLGLNTRLRSTDAEEPLQLYVNDYDENDQVEGVMTYHLEGREIPFANYMEVTKQLPPLKKKYLMSKDFAAASIEEIFGRDKIKKALTHEINELRSMYFENVEGEFVAHPLPDFQQIAPLMTAAVKGEGEVILGGNFYEANIELGRYDADFGSILHIGPNGKLTSKPIDNQRIKGQTRNIKAIQVAGHPAFIFARNNDTAILLSPSGSKAENTLTQRN